MGLRGAGLLVTGVAVQGVVGFTSTSPALLIVSMSLIALFLWINRAHVGLLIACVGLVANVVAIGANGGMPVSQPAMARIGSTAIDEHDTRHTYADDETRVRFLGDVLPVGGKVVSPGDMLLAAGLLVFLISLCRRVLSSEDRGRIDVKPG